MKTIKRNKSDVGVIVARFQVHKLHEAHLELIENVRREHSKVIIFLGLSPTFGTRNNPLDFESRKKMIQESFPDINIHYIKDMNNDDSWSKKLDEQIADLLTPTQTVMLYGGRDSFLKSYNGVYPTTELESTKYVSGTELRKDISSRVKGTEDFRAGVIWSVNNQYPHTFTTVDIIIRDTHNKRLLLVRKPNETLYRFVGGFSDPLGESFEQDANREVFEEVGVEHSSPTYIGSLKVDDWRYRNEIDKIKTLVFVSEYCFGIPVPKDDVCEAKWFSESELTKNQIVPEHRPIFDMFVEWSNKQ